MQGRTAQKAEAQERLSDGLTLSGRKHSYPVIDNACPGARRIARHKRTQENKAGNPPSRKIARQRRHRILDMPDQLVQPRPAFAIVPHSQATASRLIIYFSLGIRSRGDPWRSGPLSM